MSDDQLYRTLGRKALNVVLNNPKNIEIIESLIFINSTRETYDLILYQTVGNIINKNKLSDIVKQLKERKVGWNHKDYDIERQNLKQQDDFIENPFEVEEGVIECKCGSKKVFSYSKQVRSADEPMTTFATCTVCKKSWTYSG